MRCEFVELPVRLILSKLAALSARFSLAFLQRAERHDESVTRRLDVALGAHSFTDSSLPNSRAFLPVSSKNRSKRFSETATRALKAPSVMGCGGSRTRPITLIDW